MLLITIIRVMMVMVIKMVMVMTVKMMAGTFMKHFKLKEPSRDKRKVIEF